MCLPNQGTFVRMLKTKLFDTLLTPPSPCHLVPLIRLRHTALYMIEQKMQTNSKRKKSLVNKINKHAPTLMKRSVKDDLTNLTHNTGLD